MPTLVPEVPAQLAAAAASLPVAPAAQERQDLRARYSMAAMPGSVPPAATGARRRVREIGASILVVALVAGVFLYVDRPVSVSGFVDMPQPAAPANARPAVPTMPVDTASERNVPAAVADTRSAALRALAVEPETATAAPDLPPAAPAMPPVDGVTPDHDAAPSAHVPAAKAVQAGKRHGTSRPSGMETALPMRKTDKPDPWRQAPPSAGPCTPTVATLGLCTAPPTDAKE